MQLRSVSFKKLFKSSLLPASVLVLAKIFAFWLMVMSLNIPWTINLDASNFLGVYPLINDNSLIRATSYMDLIFIWIVLLGLVYYLFVALIFHSSHVHPKVLTKLVKYNLTHLLKSNFNLYHEIIAWLLFAWVANILVLINSVAGRSFIGIPTFSICFTAFLTVVFFKDACNELENREKQ